MANPPSTLDRFRRPTHPSGQVRGTSMTAPPLALHAALDFGGEEITVRLGGEIDLLTTPQVAAVFDAVAGLSPDRVIVDMADVGFLSVGGLNLIAALAARLRAGNGQVVLRSTSTMTRRLLHLIDLGELLENTPPAVHRSEEASGDASGATVRSLEEMRSTARREHTIDAALNVVVAWAAATITNADSVSVTLQRRGRLTTVASSDDAATRLDLDQYATGQGPCVHAATRGKQTLVSSATDDPRWPDFLPHALDAGIGAILSSPLTIASGPVGALNVYSTTEKAFGPAERDISGLMASQAASILAGESDDLTAAERIGRLEHALRAREVIAQAQGIVMHRDEITAEAAAAHLHRESRRIDLPLGQFAAQLVAQTSEPTDPSSR